MTRENLDHRLNEYLRRGQGKFCMENTVWKYGYVTVGQFRQHLKNQVREGRLRATKDEFGRVWWERV